MAAEDSVNPALWQSILDDAFARIGSRFARVEPRATAKALVAGLLSGIGRKNCWWLAEHAGHDTPDKAQRLLRTARWDADLVRDDVRTYVAEHLGHPDGVLIVDETGILKKGTGSVGVQRQYTGTAGRIENGQVAVFLAYATPLGHALIDRRLYLPQKAWCADTDRRTTAGVPAGTVFATKPMLAKQAILNALAAGVYARWVTADEVYGGDPTLRDALQDNGIGFGVGLLQLPVLTEDPAFRNAFTRPKTRLSTIRCLAPGLMEKSQPGRKISDARTEEVPDEQRERATRLVIEARRDPRPRSTRSGGSPIRSASIRRLRMGEEGGDRRRAAAGHDQQ